MERTRKIKYRKTRIGKKDEKTQNYTNKIKSNKLQVKSQKTQVRKRKRERKRKQDKDRQR